MIEWSVALPESRGCLDGAAYVRDCAPHGVFPIQSLGQPRSDGGRGCAARSVRVSRLYTRSLEKALTFRRHEKIADCLT